MTNQSNDCHSPFQAAALACMVAVVYSEPGYGHDGGYGDHGYGKRDALAEPRYGHHGGHGGHGYGKRDALAEPRYGHHGGRGGHGYGKRDA